MRCGALAGSSSREADAHAGGGHVQLQGKKGARSSRMVQGSLVAVPGIGVGGVGVAPHDAGLHQGPLVGTMGGAAMGASGAGGAMPHNPVAYQRARSGSQSINPLSLQALR